MRIFINEFIKVFNKKNIILLFIGLLTLNGVLLYVNEINEVEKDQFYSAKAYKQIYDDIEGLTNQEALDSLEREYEELKIYYEFFILGDNAFHQSDDIFKDVDLENVAERYQSGDYLRYTDSAWAETSLYKDVIREVETCISYSEYLDNIDREAETMSQISIFAQPGSFSYRNIEKTPEDFSHLKGNELQISPSRGVKMATEFIGTDLIALFMILIIVTSLLTREKELSQLTLVKTTYLGRKPLIMSKLMVSFFSSFFVVIFLYGINFLISYQTYGFGDLNRYIQSITGYLGSNLEITVIQYFILFIIAKIMVYWLIGSIMFFVATLVRDSVEVYIALVAIFAISGVAYYVISPTSYLSLFKYVNIVSFMNTYKFFSSYLNLNIFGYPINYIPIAFATIIIGIILLGILSVNIFCKQKTIASKSSLISNKLRLYSGKIPLFSHNTTNVFRHEAYKVFIGGKVLIILLIFLGARLYTYKPLSENLYDKEDFYYKDYMLKLEGEVNEDKLKFIEEEKQEFSRIFDEMMMRYELEEENPYVFLYYQEQLEPQQALEKVIEHTKYLETQEKGEYLYDSGYKLLTGDMSAMNKDVHLALVAFIMAIACLAYIYSVEYQSGSYVLLRTSYKGRGNTLVSKLIISIIIITTIYVTTYAPYFYNVLNTYGRRGIFASANSMEHLSKVPSGISILSYLIIILAMGYIGIFLAIIVIFVLSVKLKSYIATLLASTGILILPLLMSLQGISAFDYVLLNPLIIGNVF